MCHHLIEALLVKSWSARWHMAIGFATWHMPIVRFAMWHMPTVRFVTWP